MTQNTEAARVADGLTEAQKRAIFAFAGSFSSQSETGMQREWADVTYQAGPRRSFRNTIQPLIERGLAQRTTGTFAQLTALGLAVRAELAKRTHGEPE